MPKSLGEPSMEERWGEISGSQSQRPSRLRTGPEVVLRRKKNLWFSRTSRFRFHPRGSNRTMTLNEYALFQWKSFDASLKLRVFR
jgi:hypothetical protein